MSDEAMKIPAFVRYWTASTTGSFGTAVSTVAVQVLVVQVLVATPAEVGVVNAARVLPYAFLGLFAGVLIDRVRRKPLLVWSNAAQAVALLAIPVLWLADAHSLAAVAAVLFVVGALSVLEIAARQSFLPRLVPKSALLSANARIDQGDTVAMTSGPALGGGMVALIGAPFTVLADVLTCALGAILNARLRVEEPPLPRRPSTPSQVLEDIGVGVRYIYRHRTIAPHAISTHIWFIGNAMALTAFAPFALREMGLGAVTYGVVLAFTGVGGLIGALLAVGAGLRLGGGRRHAARLHCRTDGMGSLCAGTADRSRHRHPRRRPGGGRVRHGSRERQLLGLSASRDIGCAPGANECDHSVREPHLRCGRRSGWWSRGPTAGASPSPVGGCRDLHDRGRGRVRLTIAQSSPRIRSYETSGPPPCQEWAQRLIR
jgi:predicted MFS family arabinose efflux permease